MRAIFLTAAVLALAGCQTRLPQGGGAQEQLVLGARMSFEQCRSRGGLIIRDSGSPMVACDPRVIGPVTPADEFDHPGAGA